MTFVRSSSIVALVALSTCHPQNQERATEQGKETPASVELTSASLIAPSTVVWRIAEARCDHEQVCINVGPHHRYRDRAACLDSIGGATSEKMDATKCPLGVDPDELDRCLAEVRSESCLDPGDTLDRLAACRGGNLCRH